MFVNVNTPLASLVSWPLTPSRCPTRPLQRRSHCRRCRGDAAPACQILLTTAHDSPFHRRWSQSLHRLKHSNVSHRNWTNEVHSNLATGDIALISYSPSGSTHHELMCVRGIWEPHFWEGEVVRRQRWYHSKEWQWSLTTALSLTIRPHATICQMCPILKYTGGGSHSAKIWEGVDRWKPNFNTIWKRHGAVISNRNCVDIFSHFSTIHEPDSPRKGNHHNRRNRWDIDSP